MTTLLVSASGGHLTQLVRISSRLDVVDDDQVWVTPRTPQSESLLAGRAVEYVPNISERDARGVAQSLRHANELVQRLKPQAVVSSGSGIALGYLSVASIRRVPTFYIESATRSNGPSRTGRILSIVPSVKVFTQYSSWSGRRWTYVGSIFDEFETVANSQMAPDKLRVIVTVGSSDWQFNRLVQRIADIAPAESEFVWQVGSSTVAGLPGEVFKYLPAAELSRRFREADVVIAHAGCGSAVAALEAGRLPILVPRRREHQEILDDHQGALAATLDSKGLAISRSVAELTWNDVVDAATRTVQSSACPKPLKVSQY